MKKISKLKIEKVESRLRERGIDLRVTIDGKVVNLSGNVQKMTFIKKGYIYCGEDISSFAEPCKLPEFEGIPNIYYAPFLAIITAFAARRPDESLTLESVLKAQDKFIATYSKKP